MLLMPDSSLFIRLIKRGFDPAQALLSHYDAEALATCGMVRVEVLRGLRLPKLHDGVSGFMDVMQNVITTNLLWERAAALGRRMMLNGVTIKGPDLIIAASALQIGAAVLTLDSDFERVPGLHVEHPEWIF